VSARPGIRARLARTVPATAAATAAVVACAWVALGFVEPPPLDTPARASRVLLDRRGELMSLSLTTDERYRVPVRFDEVSPHLVEATVLYEDRHFFAHFGVNPWSLVRGAAMTLLRPDRPIGGSTITMQLARLRLGLETRSVGGKLSQVFHALVLERHYTKERILEAYLNLAPYGANVEGIGAASLVYFRKPAARLAAGESVTLAVLPQNPSRRWKEAGRPDRESAAALLTARIAAAGPARVVAEDFDHSPADVPALAPHFQQRVRERFPDRDRYASTLDPWLQRDTEEVLRSTLAGYAEYGVRNGAILVAELPDMSVRAYVGSAAYLDARISGFVNGLAAQRSPGSLLKPFLYGLAIDQGIIVPQTMLKDVPIRLSSYVPENFERNFLGPISAADALVRSRNIPALELFRTLAPGSLYRLLGEAGVTRLQSEAHYGIALVLGGLGTTPEEIVQLYGLLGSGGTARPLRFLEDAAVAAGQRILSSEAAFLVSDMLSRNPPALGRFRDQRIPWKTGTSYGSRDAWAVGLVGSHVVAVWLGEFDGKPNPNLVGRDVAGPVFFSVVDRLRTHGIVPAPVDATGLNLKQVEVCALSGALPGADCPHRKPSWFIPGVSPIATCEIHRSVQIDEASGLRLCPGETGGQARVFELWDSSMLRLFAKAGLGRATPPPYAPHCGIPSADAGEIRIISPEQHVEYRLEPHRGLELELVSSAPADARQLFWFCDDALLGQVEPSRSLHWKAKIGTFLFRAVDDRGRASSVRVRVLPQTGDDATAFAPAS
jgi:penicillin-binding protein 1C